jgi:predicted esterase
VLAAAGPAAAADQSVVEATHDLLGIWKQPKHARAFELVTGQGARVLNLPKVTRFAAVWKPEGYASGRIMVLVPGTGGTPYEGLKDEIGLANAYDVMLVGLQWFDPQSETYDDPADVYRNIETVLRYLSTTEQVPLTRVALSGFSRGSAISYELAYRDLQSNKYFDLVIAHSGAIRPDGRVAPRQQTDPGQFYADFLNDRLGEAPMAGTRFFLYAGEQDEQWGAEMAENMAFTRDRLLRAGAEVTDCIIDPEGGHMGYFLNSAHHELAVKRFVSASGSDPAPVRPVLRLQAGGAGPGNRPRPRRHN